MVKQKKAWVFDSVTSSKVVLPGTLKDEVNTRARELIEGVLKPRHIKPPIEASQFNYIIDITSKWIGSTFYFISIYACPGPNAISPTFEVKFARLQYVGDARFTLSFMRHDEKWVQLDADSSLDKCLNAVQDDPWFMP